MASTLLSPMVDYYNDEEELDSVDEDEDRSFRGRDSEEGDYARYFKFIYLLIPFTYYLWIERNV